ncbi:ion transporter, partial [archaeon]
MQIVDQPNSSYMATLVAYFLVAVILLSVGVFIADSYPEVAEANDRAFNAIELFCVIVFTIEYGVRCLCAPEPRRFIFSFFNVVDLLSIAPYYIELMFGASGGSGAPMLRMVRLIRVVRLAKIGRYVTWLQIFGVTIQRSANALCMLFFIVGLLILFWATLVYFAERGAWDVDRGVWQREDGSPTSFESIPAVAWCIIVSMSVVGFGDMAATTAVGRLITGAAIFSGIVMLAVPVPIITGYLHTEYDHVQRIAALKKQHAETEAVRAAAAAAEAAVESVSGGTN